MTSAAKFPGINLVGGIYDGGFGEDAGYIPNGPYNSNPTYTYRDNISKIVGQAQPAVRRLLRGGQKNELGDSATGHGLL